MPVMRLPTGLRLHYLERGRDGRLLLLIHGNLASARWWERVMAALPPEIRILAPELRGCGDSDKPEGDWSIADLAGDLLLLARSLELPPFTVAGHSLGGAVALQMALDCPACVEGVVLINPAPPTGLPMTPERTQFVAETSRRPEALEAALAAMLPTAPRDELYRQVMADAVSKSAGAWMRNVQALDRLNQSTALAGLQVPVLILYGEQDPLVIREMMEQASSQIPGATLESWPDVGHSPPLEAPERLADRLDRFLAEHPAGGGGGRGR